MVVDDGCSEMIRPFMEREAALQGRFAFHR